MQRWFVSTFANKVDSKGRVSIPRPFRDCLGDENKSIYLVKSFDRFANSAAANGDGSQLGYLYGFTLEMLTESVPNENPAFNAESEELIMALSSATTWLPIDNEGRIALTPELRKFIGVTREALFMGMLTHFQIWNPQLGYQRQKQARSSGASWYKSRNEPKDGAS